MLSSLDAQRTVFDPKATMNTYTFTTSVENRGPTQGGCFLQPIGNGATVYAGMYHPILYP